MNIVRQLKIFVAWPSDVEEERKSVEKVIKKLNETFKPQGCYLEMLDWRNNVPPEAGNPEDIILEATDPPSWDVFIGILWKRFGTPLKQMNPKTGKPYASGFEAEYEKAHALWQEYERPHIMLYRCTRLIPYDADIKQLKYVQNFFQRIEKRYEVLYKSYGTLDDFENKLSTDLYIVVERLLEPKTAVPTKKKIETKPQKRPVPFPHSRLFEDIAEETDFSNRVNELAQIQNLLSTELGASIMVYAPSGMGKSRLIERLQKVVLTPSSGNTALSFHYIELDCHRDEKISASIEELLLAIHQKLPQPKVSSPTRSDLIQALRFQTVNLMGQNKRLIILLDRIELMNGECRAFLRDEFLPELQRVVREPAYYPAVIAFGRIYPREWRGKDIVHFKIVELSPFDKAVIKEILLRKTEELKKKEGLNLSFPNNAYDEWAESILNISHGHPRCIVNLVSWLYEQHFAVPTDFDSEETFLSFVVPVIEREILSEDNLAPLEPIEKKSEIANRLRQVLPYLCLFRSYSLAQLRILAHCKLIEENEIGELEELLSRTFLIDHPARQAAFRPHEVIRRLLADALYHQHPDVFARIHQAACEFYDAWIAGKARTQSPNLLGEILRDYEQIDYIVEGLYHHSQARRGQYSIDFLKEKLISYLDNIRTSERHTKKNLISILDRLMLDDAELKQIIRRQGNPEDYKVLLSLVENWKDSKNT